MPQHPTFDAPIIENYRVDAKTGEGIWFCFSVSSASTDRSTVSFLVMALKDQERLGYWHEYDARGKLSKMQAPHRERRFAQQKGRKGVSPTSRRFVQILGILRILIDGCRMDLLLRCKYSSPTPRG
ncbi:hypothetical protein [Bradyrhizobium archetypum]|uniref:Uncharacterized protein n=1 Tax=Bradyrhizobium archetypum TaxID=2721160 RepID=A0A7Y4H6H0_9BRAD|nr:hypothetical protein [Bradyrhizobium archetypum]NOJ48564.1 hypothetical protein [Bradyrhizobium archetypum]